MKIVTEEKEKENHMGTSRLWTSAQLLIMATFSGIKSFKKLKNMTTQNPDNVRFSKVAVTKVS